MKTKKTFCLDFFGTLRKTPQQNLNPASSPIQKYSVPTPSTIVDLLCSLIFDFTKLDDSALFHQPQGSQT